MKLPFKLPFKLPLKLPFVQHSGIGLYTTQETVVGVELTRIRERVWIRGAAFVQRGPHDTYTDALIHLIEKLTPHTTRVASHLQPAQVREATVALPHFNDARQRTEWVERYAADTLLPPGVDPHRFVIRHTLLYAGPEHRPMGDLKDDFRDDFRSGGQRQTDAQKTSGRYQSREGPQRSSSQSSFQDSSQNSSQGSSQREDYHAGEKRTALVIVANKTAINNHDAQLRSAGLTPHYIGGYAASMGLTLGFEPQSSAGTSGLLFLRAHDSLLGLYQNGQLTDVHQLSGSDGQLRAVLENTPITTASQQERTRTKGFESHPDESGPDKSRPDESDLKRSGLERSGLGESGLEESGLERPSVEDQRPMLHVLGRSDQLIPAESRDTEDRETESRDTEDREAAPSPNHTGGPEAWNIPEPWTVKRVSFAEALFSEGDSHSNGKASPPSSNDTPADPAGGLAIGLAARLVYTYRDGSNVLGADRQHEARDDQQRSDAMLVIGGVSLLVLLLLIGSMTANHWMHGQIIASQHELDQAAEHLARVDQARSALEHAKEDRARAERLAAHRTHVGALIAHVSDHVPDAVWLNALSAQTEADGPLNLSASHPHTQIRLDIRGWAHERDATDEFIEHLEGSPFIDRVQPVYVEALHRTEVQRRTRTWNRSLTEFELRLQIDR